jgi:alpha-galactosidase
MPISHRPTLQFGDMTLRFPWNEVSGRIGLEIFPTSLGDKLVPRRETLRGLPYIDAMPDAGDPPASVIDGLAQIKIVGDPYPGAFAQGHTMRASPSVDGFRFIDQSTQVEGAETLVVTKLENARQHRLEHRISWRAGDAAFQVATTFINGSSQPVTLEMLSSFSLSGITPFQAADAPGRLRVHRFRSVWSAEGRLETQSIEQLHLERSWSGAGAFSERFGQVGSMPVRRWFPFVAIEDTEAGVIWGAQLAWAGSWQMEIFRQHDDVCLSGGLADREFGHWCKTLQPGESMVTPSATLACVQGSLDELCDRLTAVQRHAVDGQPEIEQSLPIVFNEWCTTWGDPSQEKVSAIAQCLKGSDTTFLVIDAGWYKSGTTDWSSGHGDWVPSTKLFPEGLAKTAALIRERGLIPGLWFEMETVGSQSVAFSLVDHLLQRDGIPVTVRERRFWDLNDSFAIDYLTEKVIDLLESCEFGYLKVDYNETIGLGCENHGAESLGEGLRLHTLGIYRFFEQIRQRLPNLVIENCSSGGHRLEPSMLGLTAMSSFSDAHELPEIPIIAANLHRLLLPRQNQIWAVLLQADSDQRLIYSLAATFLGRMCLSGEIDRLNGEQWRIVRAAQRLYRMAAPIIKSGTSRRHGNVGESWRYPQGWQAVVRLHDEGKSALVVLHVFANHPGAISIPLPIGGGWRIQDKFLDPVLKHDVSDTSLTLTPPSDFSAAVLLLSRD